MLKTATKIREEAQRAARGRNLTKKQLQRKSNSYFATSRIIKKGRRRKETVRYLVERTYEALPKTLQKYLDANKESVITNMTQQIIAYSNYDINPYAAMYEHALHARRATGDATKEYIWSRFKREYSQIYYAFSKRVREVNPKAYWLEHVEMKKSGSIVYTICEFINGELDIDFNFSGEEMDAALY